MRVKVRVLDRASPREHHRGDRKGGGDLVRARARIGVRDKVKLRVKVRVPFRVRVRVQGAGWG